MNIASTGIKDDSEVFDLSNWKSGAAINQDRFEPGKLTIKSQSKCVLRLEGPFLGGKLDWAALDIRISEN